MRARKIPMLAAVLTVAAIILTFIFVGCQPVNPADGDGVVALLTDFVTAVNDRNAEGVARTLFAEQTDGYNAFLEKYPDRTYFDAFTYPGYQLVSLRTYEEIGANAVYAKWKATVRIRYVVSTSDGTPVFATDDFIGNYHFVKRDDGKWYFTTEPSPFEGNAEGEGFVLDNEDLPDYTVSFDSNGGTEVAPVQLKKGDAFELPAPPQREGYVFGGWYTGNDFVTEWRSTMVVNESFTLFARWTKTDGADDDSLIVAEPSDKIYGYVSENRYAVRVTVSNSLTAFKALESFSAVNGATVGAFYDMQGTTRLPEELPLTVGDNLFYVIVSSENGENTSVYRITVNRLSTHTVSFMDGDTGEPLAPSVTVDHGRYVDLSSVETPEKAGHEFSGWLFNKSPFLAEVTQITSDMVLTADWSPLPTVVRLNHLHSTLPPGASETVDVYYGHSFRFPVPVRNGYRFEGWIVNNVVVTNSDGYSLNSWAYQNSDGVPYIATASWVPIVYSISYGNIMDGSNAPGNPNTYTVSSEITFIAAKRDGYRFVGWSRSETENVPITKLNPGSYGNLTIYAVWEAIDYTVNFYDADGNSLAPSQTVSTNDVITRPANPSETGKTFVGWYTEPEYKTMWDFRNHPRGNDERFNLYARFTDEYTEGLVFSVNGLGTSYSISEYHGSNPVPIIPENYLGLPVVAVEGYAFSGTKVKEIRLPSKVTRIAIGAFTDCSDLEILTAYASDVAAGALSGTSSLRELTITNYNGELGELFGTASYSNSYEAGLPDETGQPNFWQIPNSLTDVRYLNVDVWRLTPYAFANFVSLKSVQIRPNVEEEFRIGHHAFYGCSGLETVILPVSYVSKASSVSIGYHTFDGCSNLKTFGTDVSDPNFITLPQNTVQIGRYAFAGVKAPVILNRQLERIDETSFSRYAGERIIVNHSIRIEDGAFTDATKLKYFGSSSSTCLDLSEVGYMGLEVFSGCSSVTEVKLPLSGAERIRKRTFSGCVNLSAVTFTDQTELASDSFARCSSLREINLPATLNLIEASTFYGCVNLETVTRADLSVNLDVKYHAFANTKITSIDGNVTLDDNWNGNN